MRFAATPLSKEIDEYTAVEMMTTTILQCTGEVRGVAAYGDSIYVITDKSKGVDVYNAVTLDPKEHISIPDLVDPRDITFSGDMMCVATATENMKEDWIFMYRLSKKGGRATYVYDVKFPLIASLSATKNGGLLVMLQRQSISEITSFTGKEKPSVIKEIPLPLDLCHVIKTGEKSYLVCHGTYDKQPLVFTCQRLSEDDIQFVNKAPTMPFREPCYLAVDKSGLVFVADCERNVVLLCSSDLQPIKDIIKESAGLQKPYRICLDKTRGKLYVVEKEGNRVLIFDIKRACHQKIK